MGEITRRARELRSAMSDHEVRLWSRLRRFRDRGFHIRRQAPIRGYFADFACYGRRLIIEVDGSHHAEPAQAAHDRRRDAVLNRAGFRVLRIPTAWIDEDLDAVEDQIRRELGAWPTPTRADAARRSTLPMKGREEAYAPPSLPRSREGPAA